ncbi:MAG: hypothetical protein ACO2Z2_11455, partial [Paracoccaceae bacterium]
VFFMKRTAGGAWAEAGLPRGPKEFLDKVECRFCADLIYPDMRQISDLQPYHQCKKIKPKTGCLGLAFL